MLASEITEIGYYFDLVGDILLVITINGELAFHWWVVDGKKVCAPLVMLFHRPNYFYLSSGTACFRVAAKLSKIDELLYV
jgi:hypothetical protein